MSKGVEGTFSKNDVSQGDWPEIVNDSIKVFHRTPLSSLLNNSLKGGFKPLDAFIFGSGFFGTTTIDTQIVPNMKEKFKNVIITCDYPLKDTFIFEYGLFRQTELFQKLGSPSLENFLKKQCDYFNIGLAKEDHSFLYKKPSIDAAIWLVEHVPDFFEKCSSIIFINHFNGVVLFTKDESKIQIRKVSEDGGKTWTLHKKYISLARKRLSAEVCYFNKEERIPELFGITNYSFGTDGLLNVFEDVKIKYAPGGKLPFKFGTIHGSFDCSSISLSSLEGAPQQVFGSFDCSHNNLESLIGGPLFVQETYNCSLNSLGDLLGAPKIAKKFKCSRNLIQSLKNIPLEELDSFDCSNNRITSLKGFNTLVHVNFNCSYNFIESLKGSPLKLSGSFDCSNNLLRNFKKGPKKVGGFFYFENNPTTSRKGFPKRRKLKCTSRNFHYDSKLFLA